ncbi:Fis family transcriptional regulator [Methylobacterium sp. Leaf469]|uniref:sigma-54-dependent transcriptional regulator n=1 Tax=unclassified Methylobacterium TaxID=2615210 RepID=UPI0006F3131F|nr:MULTISPECIES: sigma-54 dependent transcriptional regulator [unclassified Methylobacterium]USU33773.1 sigma-54 dependent transcriptional regulator [Methylobacterium sp. OTU13CASTA1]KQO65893.1 Fis family transcriptional regulator [Methylobacterium sp. Leaf87]KQP34656.1 Fis family transcriptional regulator [Methylobacterium sp. Leaf102]KQP71992.1 Fis family transcriptional regulator [Methylobacterium sp. Leaf112]KQU05728.1 Fis family transcriptional regulator [Methylobacterium sp. Leaf469]
MSEPAQERPSPERVVFIDDEADVCRANRQSLELDGFIVETFGAAGPALAAIMADPPGLVVTDVRLPDLDGVALFARLRGLDPDLPVILITGHGDIRMAVGAMRDGAYDFLAKPYPAEALMASARRALERRRLVLENRALRARLDAAVEEDPAFLGISPEMVRLRSLVREVANADVDVLVFGETGSGKEVVASALHRWSRRARRNFVAMNCGALPDSVVESELFGHEAGAFTGALKRRVGRIEHAQGGTLFLDEIESMPLNLQVKLLRVLQERSVEPLGTNEVRAIDMRVVAATKVDLGQAAAQGTFRDDLYHRLNVITIPIPPLRDRREDVMLLFQEFLRRAAARFGREVPPITPDVRDHLRRHDWPGNVRELGHFAERHALGLGRAETAPPGAAAAGTLAEQVDRFERGLIREELFMAGGDVRLAAESLGTPRKTLYDKIARHGLAPTDYR